MEAEKPHCFKVVCLALPACVLLSQMTCLRQAAGEEMPVSGSSGCLPFQSDEDLQDSQQQTQRHLMQLLLRHSLYSPQLLSQLREADVQRETEGVADTFLRLQACLIRLLEIERQADQQIPPLVAPRPSITGFSPSSAAVAAALASSLEKTVPFLRCCFPLSKNQQLHPQVAAVVGRLFSPEGLAHQPEETEGSSDASSAIMEVTEDAGRSSACDSEQARKCQALWEPQVNSYCSSSFCHPVHAN